MEEEEEFREWCVKNGVGLDSEGRVVVRPNNGAPLWLDKNVVPRFELPKRMFESLMPKRPSGTKRGGNVADGKAENKKLRAEEDHIVLGEERQPEEALRRSKHENWAEARHGDDDGAFSVMTWNVKNLGYNFPGRDYSAMADCLCQSTICAVQEAQWHPKLGTENEANLLFRLMDQRGFDYISCPAKTFHPEVAGAGEYPLLFYRRDSVIVVEKDCYYLPVGVDPQAADPFKRNPFVFTLELRQRPGKRLAVVSFHGDIDKVTRSREIKALAPAIPASIWRDGSLIICADMNFASKREHDAALRMWNETTKFTFESVNGACKCTGSEVKKKRSPLDHIWLDPSLKGPLLFANLRSGAGNR